MKIIYRGAQGSKLMLNGMTRWGAGAISGGPDTRTPMWIYNDSMNEGERVPVEIYLLKHPEMSQGSAQTIEYSTDMVTWTSVTIQPQSGWDWDNSQTIVTIAPEGTVYFRMERPNSSLRFRARSVNNASVDDPYIKVGGNAYSMVYGSSFNGQTELRSGYTLQSMFNGFDWLKQANELQLSALTMLTSYYSDLFGDCRNLMDAPVLPATTMANQCYNGMFAGCSSLATPPALPAMTLAEGCYSYMFRGSGIERCPDLPATTLANGCYSLMFEGCEGLTETCWLPATTLVSSCYWRMFASCWNLEVIRCLATNPSQDYEEYWTGAADHDPAESGVAEEGTFYKKAGVTWPEGYHGIPTGWTVVEV